MIAARTTALGATVLLLGLVGCGRTPAEDSDARPPANERVAGVTTAPEGTEQLLASAPEGWRQVFRSERAGTRLVEFVAPDSPLDEWTEKLAFESFGGTPLPDPADMLARLARDQSETCPRFSDHATFDGEENGYAVAVRLFVCGEDPLTRSAQVTLIKAIRGEENVYVITRARRLPPIAADAEAPALPTETMAEWSLFMRAITVCEVGDAEHACPPPETDDSTVGKISESGDDA
jgi:hypothetical protein